MAAVESKEAAAAGLYIPSLFDPDSEEESLCDEAESEEQYHPKQIPLNDVISSTPKRLSQLLEILLPRLQPHPQIKTLSASDQQSFIVILVGELASQFSLLQQQIDDPFLTPSENRELHRRVTVRVCCAVEEVYAQFVKKASDIQLTQGGVFTPAAAMTRLRAQLILQANKSINLPVIRRRVLQELRGPSTSPRQQTAQHPSSLRSTRKSTSTNELKPLSTGMLQSKLDRMRMFRERLSAHLGRVISRRPQSLSDTALDQKMTPENFLESDDEDRAVSDQRRRHHSILRRVMSMPELYVSNSNLLMSPTNQDDAKSTANAPVIKRYRSVDSIKGIKLTGTGVSEQLKSTRMGEYTSEQLSQDLRALVDKSALATATAHTSNDDDAEELPPLLLAHVPGLSKSRAQRLRDFIAQRYPPQITEKKPDEPVSPGFPEGPPPLASDYGHYDVHFELPCDDGSAGPSMALEGAAGSSLRSSSFLADDRESLSQSLPVPSTRDSLRLPGSTVEEENESMMSSHPGSQHSSVQQASSVTGNEFMSSQMLLEEAEEMGEFEQGTLDHSSMDFNSELTEPLDNTTSPQQISSEEEEGECMDGPQPQPDTVTLEFTHQNVDVAEMSDTRVGEREMQGVIQLKPYPAVYNDLTGELDSLTLEELDSNLKTVEQISDIFSEISKTVTKDYLDIQKDEMLVPCIDVPVDLSGLTASNSLYHRKGRRVINEALRTPGRPPWMGSRRDWMSRSDWDQCEFLPNNDCESGCQHIPLELLALEHSIAGDALSEIIFSEVARIMPAHDICMPRSFVKSKRFSPAELTKRSKKLSVEDYLKFTTYRSSDFLGLVHHLYDSSGGDSEEEEREMEKKRALKELQDRQRAEEERRHSLLSTKMLYQPGMWNVNSVMMGGLAYLPDEMTDSPSSKLDLSSVQEQFDHIWSQMEFPNSLRSAAAYKYSNPFLAAKLPKVLHLWEEACALVLRREELLSRLEQFEEKASDPARHFAKGPSGVLLEEAKVRSSHHKEINSVEKSIVVLCRKLAKYSDVVTYQGRNYLEKMSMDRTEMLYCIHQKRRQAVLQPAMQVLRLNQVQP